MSHQTLMWLSFTIIIAIMLFVDLGLQRKSHEVSFREALFWSLIWITLAMLFTIGISLELGKQKALEFLTGYIIEKSLSVDNLFVFIMIFSYFHVPKGYQPKILKWGILGALIMRALFIFVGIELLHAFHWMIYLFGAILIITGIRMSTSNDGDIRPEKNLMVRLVRRFVPITKRIKSDRFFVRRSGLWAATPLFLTLVVVESSDVIFAVDSIPAILAVTTDPFIVYTSNIFAILGLRALYFLLASMLGLFVYLKLGVSFILAFVGVKMLLADIYPIPVHFSLGVILAALTISIVTSLTIGNRHKQP
ncbi:MAG TPA: TerC family protein [Geobacterales bacterium]|nr:TerC family protein [Geobacterales bacterium]